MPLTTSLQPKIGYNRLWKFNIMNGKEKQKILSFEFFLGAFFSTFGLNNSNISLITKIVNFFLSVDKSIHSLFLLIQLNISIHIWNTFINDISISHLLCSFYKSSVDWLISSLCRDGIPVLTIIRLFKLETHLRSIKVIGCIISFTPAR